MKVAIIGYGVYGKATAKLLNNSGVLVYARTDDKSYTSIRIEDGIKVTNDYKECLRDASLVYVLIPAVFTQDAFKSLKEYISDDMIIILGSKGILDNGMLIEDALKSEIFRPRYACISGPTFAKDIEALEPIGFTIATKSKDDFEIIKKVYHNVKLEYTSDTTGVELCGVLKNAYAIGSGMIDGFKYGDSTRALYITSVINEMKNILSSFGAEPNTVYSLAGLGDTLMTCTSNTSRNYTFGNLFSTNHDKVKEYLDNTTVEGYGNIRVLHELLHQKSIDAPILNKIYDIVMYGSSPDDLIKLLLN